MVCPRTKIMNLSEAIYYFGTLLAQKTANNFSTFADMAGRSVGTVTGFTLVPELKGVEGIGEVKLYDTSDGVLQDLVAGRLDMAILDPPLVQWGIVQHPEWDIKQVELAPEAAHLRADGSGDRQAAGGLRGERAGFQPAFTAIRHSQPTLGRPRRLS